MESRLRELGQRCYLNVSSFRLKLDDPGDSSETRTKASLMEQVVTNPLTAPAYLFIDWVWPVLQRMRLSVPVVLTFTLSQMYIKQWQLRTFMVAGLKQQRLHRVRVRAPVHVSGIEMTCPCVNPRGGLGVLRCKSRVWTRGGWNFSIVLPFNNSVLPTIQTKSQFH